MKKRMKLLVFILHFWLNSLCGINNDKSDKKIQQHKYKKKQQMQHKIKYNLKRESKTSGSLKVKKETKK